MVRDTIDMMENVVRTRKNLIVPINTPQNGEYGFRSGSSLVNFFLPSSPTALLTNSVKLNFKLRCNKPSSTFTSAVLCNNNTNKVGATEYKLLIDERVGCNALIDTMTWSSGNSNQTLENIRNYGRMSATTTPYHSSQYNLDGSVQGRNTPVASRTKTSGNLVNCENFVSMDLKCGLLEGISDGVVFMGRAGVQGLNLMLQLQNDQMVFQSDESDASDAFYSINDVFLTYDSLEFDADTTAELDNPQASGEMVFANYSYIYSVINSSDDQQTLNLGTRNTLSIFSSSVPVSHLNNVKQNSFSTGNFRNATSGIYDSDAILNRISFVRNSQLSPYDYSIDTKTSSLENTPRSVLINSAKEALDVLHSTETLISPATENGLLTRINVDGNEVASLKSSVSVEAQSSPCIAYGCNFDNVSGVGRDFSGNNTYGLRVESTLSGNAPNALTSFARSRNTLLYNNGSISVSS